MATNLSQIKSVISGQIAGFRKNYNLSKIGVFGSMAKGDNTNNSDVDILVEFSKPVSLFKFIELEQTLSKILGRKVDLVTKNALKSTIKNEILNETIYV